MDRQKLDSSLFEMARELSVQGTPVLVITPSVLESKILGRLFKKGGVPYQVLNAENEYQENQIISRAGCPGVITISTNMSGGELISK